MFCPKKKGYFPYLLSKIEESLSVEDKATFGSLKNNEDRIKFVLRLPRLSSQFEDNLFKIIRPWHGEKSKEKSEENRESGNAAFHSANYRQAQILYSIAVFTAPKETEENLFALALANRSASLQRLGSFTLAISDIELALNSGYPRNKAFKLHERKAECLEQLGDIQEARATFHKAISSLEGCSIPKDKRDKVKQGLLAKLDKLGTDTPGRAIPRSISESLIHEIVDSNPLYPSAHKAIEIRYDPHFGRHAIATEDILMGTTIINERPISYALYAEKFGSNCQHCFSVIRAVIPCPDCTWVCFCSVQCRDTALRSYHRFECSIIKLIVESGLNVYSFLALRAVCSQGLDKLLELRDDLENRDETKGATADRNEVYYSNDFRNFFNLSAQEFLLDREEWFLRTFIACFLIKLLGITSYFSTSKSKMCEDCQDLTEDQLFIAKIILQLINICPFNCHDISEIESPVKDQFAPTCVKVSLGAGVFPTLALLNHACTPDFMRCNRGNGVVCISSRHILKGQEIFENYGVMYTMKAKQERQKVLRSHYKFECFCQACVEEWPSLPLMKSQLLSDPDDKQMLRFKRFKCVHCRCNLSELSPTQPRNGSKITCLVCGQETDIYQDVPLNKIKELSRHAVQCLLTGQWNRGIDSSVECYELIQLSFSLPVLELTDIQIAIWKCMWLLIGNIKLVKLI